MLKTATPRSPTSLPAPDLWLWLPGVLLLALGLLMLTSASIPEAARQGQPFYFVIRQCFFLGVALLAGLLTYRISLESWYRYGPWLLFAAILLLVLVLLPGIGREVKGSARWIGLGPFNLQASELAKLFVLVYVAGYLQRHRIALQHTLETMIRLLVVLGLVAVLMLLEPDFGTTVVLMITALGLVFLAGVNVWRFAALQGLVIIAMGLLIYSSEYRWARLISFMDPWADPFNKGFQLTQALIAIGRGELFGVGLGASIQKLSYLPEAHTDFLFSILAEELGLIGVLVTIGLYAVIVYRAFALAALAEQLEQYFAAYLAYGLGLWIGIQALFNMGVNMGVLPTKGLTLPLISYGGSSLIVMCVALALLIRINGEIQALHDAEKPAGAPVRAVAGASP
ncbi:MAG: putative lipid II flippase FtsW [Gammaproteobacteria bacterium]|nr:putative lipid II flippase FtsW [Gammaproteobacteria bacterium]MCP5423747.1 putative lipid II flippase FtsW [Gammaproteobacteria bacterium]MCP5459671.1 putative lipid II flippase FtsW [Gammaproteobacteria bacterium]